MSIFNKKGEVSNPNPVAPNPPVVVVKPPIVPVVGELIDPPWLIWARGEMGIKEIRGGENPRILFYDDHTSLDANEDEVAWCAAFVSTALEENGLKSTHDAWAQSYTNFGRKLDKPIHGCIVVFRWSADHGHVTFYDAKSHGEFPCLGGNQSDQVKVSDFAANKGSIVGLRWPADYPLPGTASIPVQPVENGARPKPLKGWVKEYTDFLVSEMTPEIIESDKSAFVANYKSYDQKRLAAAIFQAICSPESDFDRCCRYVETGLGKDQVTGRQNTSEGLLQVSYQDSIYYGAHFDWSKDRSLADSDSNKTIFDPYNNLDCGIRIMTKLLKQRDDKSFVLAGARYWSSLRSAGLNKTLAYLKVILPLI